MPCRSRSRWRQCWPGAMSGAATHWRTCRNRQFPAGTMYWTMSCRAAAGRAAHLSNAWWIAGASAKCACCCRHWRNFPPPVAGWRWWRRPGCRMRQPGRQPVWRRNGWWWCRPVDRAHGASNSYCPAADLPAFWPGRSRESMLAACAACRWRPKAGRFLPFYGGRPRQSPRPRQHRCVWRWLPGRAVCRCVSSSAADGRHRTRCF